MENFPPRFLRFLQHLNMFLNFSTQDVGKSLVSSRKKSFWWATFNIGMYLSDMVRTVRDRCYSNFFVLGIAFIKPKGRVFAPQDTGTALRMRSPSFLDSAQVSPIGAIQMEMNNVPPRSRIDIFLNSSTSENHWFVQ